MMLTHPIHTPEGWYPNPDGSPNLRYWNGASWTEHVAPHPAHQPVQTPEAQPQEHQPVGTGSSPQPQTPVAAPANPNPVAAVQRQRIWNWKTWLTLVVCIALVVAVSMWSKSMERQNRVGTEADAPEVLTSFLDSITTNDASWQEVVTDSYLDHLEDRKPVYGDPATAEVLDLKVNYSFDEIEYVKTHADYYPSNPLGSDLAQTIVHFTYEYTVLEETFTSTVQQAVFMTRPYYYEESSIPSPADIKEERVPTAIGPWQVTNMRSPITVSDDFPALETISDYHASAPLTDPYACVTDSLIFLELSETARIDGSIDSKCAHASDGGFELGPNLTHESLSQGFPVLNIKSALPRELMRINDDSSVTVPLEQFQLRTDNGPLIITFASETENDVTSHRVISIVKEAA